MPVPKRSNRRPDGAQPSQRSSTIWPEIAEFGTTRNLLPKPFLYFSEFIRLLTF